MLTSAETHPAWQARNNGKFVFTSTHPIYLRLEELPLRSSRFAMSAALAVALAGMPTRAQTQPQLDAGFRQMYELRFDRARAEFTAYQRAHPEDPLGPASEAASYLFEEFNQKGVFTSAFFLDDKKLLGGVEGPPDEKRRAGFFDALKRTRDLAAKRLKTNARDPDALLAVTLANGMEGDYDALILKRQLASLHFMRQAEGEANTLLAVKPDAQDAYVALGAVSYIIGCMPGYKRAFLWFGGVHGDRQRGMDEMRRAADGGHYLKPFAKAMLALAALREHQPELARTLFGELTHEFPDNPVFAHEYSLTEKSAAKH
jgi:hypothetical protein